VDEIGMNLQGKRILVLGLGESGLAMAQWLHHCGALLRLADTRSEPAALSQLREIVPDVEFASGAFQEFLLQEIDIVAVSPGLSPLKELQEILLWAKEKNIPVWGEMEFFAQALAELKVARAYQPKIIAITGTNGKTTVTSLVGLLCERAGLRTRIAGNISPAALAVLRTDIEQDNLPEVWVLELSSFQLHMTYSLQASVATVLNITQDHLDWHGSFTNYCQDKARIFSETTTQVLNRDDPFVMALAKTGARQISFGIQTPTSADALGLQYEHGMCWMVAAVNADEDEQGSKRKKKAVAEQDIIVTRLMPVDALKIRGLHNAANALAALALCREIGLPLAPLLHGLREYQGEPHRVELIAQVAGVDYIDDSKGTNVGATVAALKGLGQESSSGLARVILIAGGEGKGQDFEPLLEPVQQYVKRVVLIGRAAAELREVLQGTTVTLEDSASLEQAVQAAAAAATTGDIVLLSPACASLDMFRNYAHRAQVFIDAVQELALSRGEVC
jgi:UDP-N-acetylmuramoylalanine--D-glutamate ligase